MPVVQRGGDVRLLEGGDERQRGGRVDQPTPGTLAGDDQSTRPEGGHVGAIVNEAGAHHREGLGLGRRSDRDHLRRLDQINAGCYGFRRSVIDQIPAGWAVSVERQTFPGLIEANAIVMGYPEAAYWLNVGTPEAYVQGSRDIVLGVLASLAMPGPTGESLVLGHASVAAGAKAVNGTAIGTGSVIEDAATVEGSVVFDGATIAAGGLRLWRRRASRRPLSVSPPTPSRPIRPPDSLAANRATERQRAAPNNNPQPRTEFSGPRPPRRSGLEQGERVDRRSGAVFD